MPTIGEIAAFLGAGDSLLELSAGAANTDIHRPMSIGEAVRGDVTYCGATARYPQRLLERTHASLLLIDRGIHLDESALVRVGVEAVLPSDNSRLDFIRVVERYFTRPRPSGIHPTAVISPSATIASDVYIGPYCSIGEARIGAGTVIHAGVCIYDGVRIGANVTIHAAVVIGAHGYGYQRNEENELERFPHVGGVVIEDDVEIYAMSHVARGTLGDTVIGKGSKIDAFVHVGHNVRIGRHCAVTSHCMLGGGLVIGDYSWLAPCACIRDRITIGSEAMVGLGAVVVKEVPDRVTVMGNPAREMNEFKRLLHKLGSMIKAESDTRGDP